MSAVAPTAAAPMPGPPRVIEVAPGSTTLPAGVRAAAPAAPPGAVPAAGAAPVVAAPGVQQAGRGVSLLRRALAIMPLATGLTQLVLGLMITKGTVSLIGVPLLGSLPKFIVGGLVASSAGPSVISGVMQLLGKQPPAVGAMRG